MVWMKKAFSLSEGVLVIEFSNNISLRFGSAEEIGSIIIRAERYYDSYPNEQIKDDIDFFSIDARDCA